MSLKALVILFLRGVALWQLVVGLGLLLRAAVTFAADVTPGYAMGMSRSSLLIQDLIPALLFLILGGLIHRFASRLAGLFGRNLDVAYLQVVNAEVLIAGVYAVFGVILIAYSTPGLIGDLLRLQALPPDPSGLGVAAELRASLLVHGLHLVIGGVLLVYARRLPPLLSSREASHAE